MSVRAETYFPQSTSPRPGSLGKDKQHMYKIMFVDDDPLILRRLHQILDWQSMDFAVLPDACDGISALALLKSAVPDIIICDINMPNMDGLELAAILKEHYPDVQCILCLLYRSAAADETH